MIVRFWTTTSLVSYQKWLSESILASLFKLASYLFDIIVGNVLYYEKGLFRRV